MTIPEYDAEARTATAARLYDAECALHAAHMAHLDAWIAAADAKLHSAIGAYFAATIPAERGGHRGRCAEVLFQSDDATVCCPNSALPSTGRCVGHSVAAYEAGTLQIAGDAGVAG